MSRPVAGSIVRTFAIATFIAGGVLARVASPSLAQEPAATDSVKKVFPPVTTS